MSKWENGNGVPDTNILPKLCEVLEISVNELLNGERISAEHYVNRAENKLLELQEVREKSDKRLLQMEIVIGVLSVIILLSLTFIASFLEMKTWLRIFLIIFGLVTAFVGFCFALKIEQVAGYYVCTKCNYKYIPTYTQVLMAPHNMRSRYMKCPHCKKKSWQKKAIK